MSASIVGYIDPKVQVGEPTRLDLTRSYVHPGDHNIQLVEVTIDGETYDITTDKYIDYDWASAGTKTLSVHMECSGQGHLATDKDFTIEVVTAETENLFSKDSDIIAHEPDLFNYLPEGKKSYHYVHRLAQDRILSEFDEQGLTDSEGNKLTASAIVNIEEVNDYSKFKALQYIFESLSNAVDDIFHEKSLRYREMAKQASNRSILRLDTNGDATVDTEVSISTGDLTRV